MACGVFLSRSGPRRRGAVVTMLRAGMGKIPNYFKSAQKELLSLGGKLIDKMKDYDKDNIPTKVRGRGVPAVPSLRCWDSWPSHEVGGRFLSCFGPRRGRVATASPRADHRQDRALHRDGGLHAGASPESE